MDVIGQLYQWPTVIWAGMITLVFAALTVLTLTDNKPFPKWLVDYFDLQSEARKKSKKKGKR